jgi:putative SOS response-associated peptidase YedK
MPVILPPDVYEQWLDSHITEPADLAALLVPYAPEAMVLRPVNPIVNSPARDDPRCIEPLRQQTLFE